jgi:hypothetical protein
MVYDRRRAQAQALADCLTLALRVVAKACVTPPWIDEDVAVVSCPHALTAWRRLEIYAGRSSDRMSTMANRDDERKRN